MGSKSTGGREPRAQDLTSARQAIHFGATSRAQKAKTSKFTRDLPHEPFNQASIYKPNHQIYYEQLVGEKMTDVITERKNANAIIINLIKNILNVFATLH